jgi:hypothetical protein
MACKLNTEQISDVFGIIYHKISNSQGPLNIKDLVKFFYDLALESSDNDVDKAMLYAQAVPDIFSLVTNDSKINKALLKMKFNMNSLMEIRAEFEDLENVKKTVTKPPVNRKTKAQLEKEIEKFNYEADDIQISEPDNSELEKSKEKAKIEYPNVTTFQFAENQDPSQIEPMGTIDTTAEDKKLFEKVVKNIVKSLRERSDLQNNPTIDGVEVFLKLMRADQIPSKFKLRDQVEFEKRNKNTATSSLGVYAVLSDIEGNILYFDSNGNITDEESGTLVYQFIRKPYLLKDVLQKNKKALFLIYNKNNKRYKNTLVSADKIAKRSPLSSRTILERQTKLMNGVYKMRYAIEKNNETFIVPITDGSFGILNPFQEKVLNQTLNNERKITREDIIGKKVETSKENKHKGLLKLHIQKQTEQFGELDLLVYIQRGNFTQELAQKVASVITSTATNKGETLSNDERVQFFKNFIYNKLSATGISIDNVNNVLTLKIKDATYTDEEIFTPAVGEAIVNHLMTGVVLGNNVLPVNINIYNPKIGQTFTDYEINGNTITPVEKDYIDTLMLPYVSLQYAEDSANLLSAFNPNLSYGIPEEFADGEYFPIASDTQLQPQVTKKQETKNTQAEKSKVEKVKTVAAKKVSTKETVKKEKVEEIIDDQFQILNNTVIKVKTDKGTETSSTLFDEMERSKQLDNFLDKLFTTKADVERAEAWWANSPLSKFITLNRISQIVNSNAFATFSGTGITLYEADGGTAVDLYHEAWHGFSQLFLTRDEKIKLYNELKAYPKWADKSYFDIEEDIAEDFRDYAKSKGKKEAPKGFLGKVFQRIYNFLNKLFGKASKEQVITRPRDIASVKELFDKLYQASERPELLQNMQPSTDNMMFTQLNRLKAISSVKDVASHYEPFTPAESLKIVNYLDSLIPEIFNQYNNSRQTSSGPIKVLKITQNRKFLYKILDDKIKTRYEEVKAKLANDAINDVEIKNSNLDELTFLSKVLDNFGDIDSSLTGKDKKGVIAFHLEKSRFKILNNKFVELEEDPTDINQSRLVKLDGGNTVSSRDMASQETKTILSSIYKIDKNKSKFVTNENGDTEFIVEFEKDVETGLPVLLDEKEMWSKVAKVVAGSFDKTEMYNRLKAGMYDNPEFIQLLSYLPNPDSNTYVDQAEFDIETKFWQDLKKPRLSYIQLNLDISKKENEVSAKAKVSRSDFDRSKVLQHWTSNFLTNQTSKYLKLTKTGQYILDIDKVVENFKNLNSNNVINFLNALGINMDLSSPTILSEVSNPNFITKYGIGHIYDSVVQVSKMNGDDKLKFLKNPVRLLQTQLPSSLDPGNAYDSSSRIKELANIQVRFSDKYSNFSALSPEGNRVWEHFLDNTYTRIMTSLNHSESFQQLTNPDADPNDLFRHMRYLSPDNNTFVMHSMLMKSMYNSLLSTSEPGKRKNKLLIRNVAGTQLIDEKLKKAINGVSTASMDKTSKFLQEIHSMLMNGVEEFMRHASKQTAQGIQLANGIQTYDGKKDKNLYVEIDKFLPTTKSGEKYAFDILSGYLAGEVNRIFKFSSDIGKYGNFAGYNRDVKRKTGSIVMAGQALTAFEDVLSTDTQRKIYNIVDAAAKRKDKTFDFSDVYNADIELTKLIRQDIAKYFDSLTKDLVTELNKTKFVDSALRERISNKGVLLTEDESDNVLMKAYAYNSWIHKFETAIVGYGDLALYNHAKEEFHKRNAGFGSGGLGFASDLKTRSFINSMPKLLNKFQPAKPYDGTLTTAIIKERVVEKSLYYDEYYDALVKDYTSRLKDKTKAEELAKTALKEYNNMKIGDGQGHITLESYRTLKNAEGNWLPEQEELYKKLAKGEDVSVEDIVHYFPPYKLQYCGAMESTGLPLVSFHKFSLAPIIPGVAKQGTPLYDLNQKMMKDGVDYVIFPTGSKVGHIGSGDEVYDDDGKILMNVPFTKNVIFTEFLKNQTEINSEFKGKSIFSTQMRKLILDNLYENGTINSPNEADVVSPIVKKYLDNVSDYTELVKTELLEEIGFDETSTGQYVPRDKDSIGKLLSLVRNNLESEESYSDQMIDFIDALDSGELLHDLSLHPEALKIEKLLLSLVNKRVIKQKVKGEPLVQVSSAFYENNLTESPNFKNATEAEKKKWTGSTVLPTYHRKEDGKTAAMKVMIALQGDYANLLNLEYKGETIGDIDTLNKAIKDDEWLDANDGANRKAITLVGVRIPVQGLNSMEFMEVYEFLPAQAGNIIIPPAEIVAKSGGDFDIDKLTIFMTNIGADGTLKGKPYKSTSELKKIIEETRKTEPEALSKLFKNQKAGLENELIDNIKEILELPQNFVSLITPNGTFLLKDIADDLSKSVMEYNPLKNYMSSEPTTEPEKNKKIISGTRVLEPLYNLYKHESNIVGKKTLGLGAVENTFNVLLNSIGALMPETHTNYKGETRPTFLALRHNKRTVDGKERISLSNMYDVDNTNKIADVFSQAMNGWVDVEKDAWIFFIQGNYEVAPILLYLVKAGVPVKEAIYFVSQPLVREYVNEQRLIKSTFAPLLGKDVESKNLVKPSAVSNIIAKYFDKADGLIKSKPIQRLEVGEKMLEKVMSSRKEKTFTESEMKGLIENSAKNKNLYSSELSKTMFLHFLDIEAQIKGITQLKMSSNPDTSTKSVISAVETSEENLENLENNPELQPILEALMKDSVISSFFNNKLILSLAEPLFKLRYHKAIRSFFSELDPTSLSNNIKNTFGEAGRDNYINTFRNDLVSYIFQNALVKTNLTNGYMSYDAQEIPTKKMVSEKIGAFVKTEANGNKTLYYDFDTLTKEFDDKVWEQGQEEPNTYSILGLHSLPVNTFDIAKGQNRRGYARFVMEREYLRSAYPIAESGLTKPEYEKFLANKALDNTYNINHLFRDEANALPVRINNIILNHPEMVNKFDILSKLQLNELTNNNSDVVMYNLDLVDKDIDNVKANVYTSNLSDLANPVVLKKLASDLNLSDKAIAEITDVFSKLPMFAYLQSGINKTSSNLVPFVDATPFLNVMDSAVKDFTENLNNSDKANVLLNDFYNKFNAQNDFNNLERNRFKNYFTGVNFDKIESRVGTTQPQATTQASASANAQAQAVSKGFKLSIDKKGKDQGKANLANRFIGYGAPGTSTYQYELDAKKAGIPINYEGDINENTIAFVSVNGNNKATEKIIFETIENAREVLENGGTIVMDSTFDATRTWNQNGEALVQEGIGEPTGQTSKGYNYWGNNPEAAQPQAEAEVETKNLKATNDPNVFIYDDSKTKTADYYRNITDSNSTVLFVYNATKAEVDSSLILGMQGLLKFVAPDTTLPFIISIGSNKENRYENFTNLASENYQGVKNYFDRKIQELKNIKDKGGKIALPIEGIGTLKDLDGKIKMPQELFVYLSKRLFEELGYINPGSTIYKDITDIISNKQGISDEEILEALGFESDPFNCV